MSHIDIESTTRLTDIFGVKEIPDPNKVVCGIATKPEDREARLRLVTTVYLDRKYIEPEDPSITNGLYIDPYEKNSIPLVAKLNGTVVASMRLIRNVHEGLPINNDGVVIHSPHYKLIITRAPFEVSQLAKSYYPEIDPQANPVLGLIASYFAIARELKTPIAAGVVDNKVHALLNRLYRFGLPAIGPSIPNYKGSPSTPIFIDINAVIQSTTANGHPEIGAFLAGERNIPGFEWYVGP